MKPLEKTFLYFLEQKMPNHLSTARGLLEDNSMGYITNKNVKIGKKKIVSSF